jgi:phosphatidate cytidylyltransferase
VPAPEAPGPAAASGPEKAKSSAWALPLRVASGVLFVPLLLLLARVGGLAFLGFTVLQVMLGLREFFGMMRGKGLRPNVVLGYAAAVGVCVLAYRPYTPHAALLATAALLLLLSAALRHPERRGIVEGMAVTAFGVLYVGWLSAHFVLLRELPWRAGLDYADGARLILFAFLVTWSCDSGAYLVGRTFGRTRPWGAISPRKSLEGSAGGFAFALAGSLLGARTFMHGPSGTPWLSTGDALAIGALVGLCGQVGDLVESLLKRDSQSGDSSEFIPGHGGVLDRFDSLYFAAPIVYYYLKVAVFQVP